MKIEEPETSKHCEMFWINTDLVWKKAEARDIKETKEMCCINM